MRAKVKRIASLLLSICLVVSLAACNGGGASSDSSSSEAPASTAESSTAPESSEAEALSDAPEASSGGYEGEVVELEFMNMDPAWKVVDFGADPVTAKFIEETGVKFKCSAPQGEWEQVANVMLAAGDYPDVMHMNVTAIYNQYVAAGALLPINKLAEEHNFPNITNGTTVPKQVLASRTSDDGNIYVVPNWFSDDGFGSVGTAMNIRNDIYNEMGTPEIKTADDLYNYLVQIKEANLTSMDGAKLWPLGYQADDKQYLGYITNLWGSKIFMFNYFDETDQQVKFMLREPALVESLTFLNKCLQEELLDPEVLTYDPNTRRESFNQGKHAVIFSEIWELWTPNSAMTQRDPEMYFYAVEPIQGNADREKFFGRIQKSGTSGTMVTKNCANPEAATRFIDYFLSPEGEILNFYGVEGNTMEFKDGKPYLYPEAYEAKLADWDGYARSHGVRVFDFMNSQKYNWEREQESPERQADRAIATKYTFDGTTQSVIIIDPLSSEGILLAEIEANITSELTRIIMEPDASKIPEQVAALLAEYERKGVEALEAEWTTQYLAREA
ncbi:MAG: extracellular solute-binding protein [Oscillospiraceae bacterium]